MNIQETVKSVPLPVSMSFITITNEEPANFEIPNATGFDVAYLAMTARAPDREGWIYYHPIVFAPGNMADRSERGVLRKVENAIAVFQAAIKGGTARMAKPGDVLDWGSQ